MTSRKLIAAWTAPGDDLPKYVNVTYVADEDPEVAGIEFTVRSPKDLGSSTSVCRVPLSFLRGGFLSEFFTGMLLAAWSRPDGIIYLADLPKSIRKQLEEEGGI